MKIGAKGNYPNSTKPGRHPLKPQKHFLLCETGLTGEKQNSTHLLFFVLTKEGIERKKFPTGDTKRGRSTTLTDILEGD